MTNVLQNINFCILAVINVGGGGLAFLSESLKLSPC
jgi:hypothetical protein